MAKDKAARDAGRILLVDDEEIIRESLGEFLQGHGFKVLLADSCDAAVRVLMGDEEIEAVICDMKMPGKSGLDVLAYINNKRLNIPLVFLTGHGTLATCQKAVREGAFDYILKPAEEEDRVIFPLKHAVEKYRLEKKNRQMRQDIVRMVDDLENTLDSVLAEATDKDALEARISEILHRHEDT
ncbi:response regulator [Verrucomicrobiota bacterium]